MSELKLTHGQKSAIFERDKNIIVSAAAGSGKTMVLVNRVISIMIEEVIDIDKMIIVTFTNKSAQDMKDKIRENLEKRAADFDPVFIKRQFKLLKLAQIKTLHSFCSDMLRENFYYLDNLSPNFKVMPDSTGKIFMAEAIDEVFDKEYEKMNEGFVYFLQNFSSERSDYNAKEIILLTYKKIVGMIDGLNWLETAKDKGESLDYFKDFISYKMDQVLKSVESLGVRLNPSLPASAVNLIASDYEMLADIRNSIDSWDKFLYSLDNKKYVTFTKKIKTEIADEDLVAEINSARDNYKALVKDIESLVTNTDSKAIHFINSKEDLLFDEIYKLTKDFKETFDKKKAGKDYLDFNDLEHEFIKLLDNPTAREKLRSKYKYIFFDEYQDSNEIQNYIVDKLKGEKNLFFVGDVKQSIYGFRRARPDLFIDKLALYEKDNDSMRINLNEILNFIYEIGELVGKISAEKEFEKNLTLRRENRIKTIYSSLAIEQNTLTLEQVTDVINGKRVLAPLKDIKEVQNAYEIYERIDELDENSVKDLLLAHKIMTSELIKESGRFRSKNAGVYQGDIKDGKNQTIEWDNARKAVYVFKNLPFTITQFMKNTPY